MIGKFAAAIIGASLLAGTVSTKAKASDGLVCDWYAIGVCSKSFQKALRAANTFGGRVVRTDNIDNFRPGFYCSVERRNSKAAAFRSRNRMRRNGAGSAYIKEGCTDN